jgi:hypothetical protein
MKRGLSLTGDNPAIIQTIFPSGTEHPRCVWEEPEGYGEK